MNQMKTPGVYIVEKNAFPNAVVEVATAVPAFIGYTETADHGGLDLQGKPWRITSMDEFEACFGGPPEPRFRVKRVADPAADPRTAVDMAQPRPQVSEFVHNGHAYRLSREPGKAGNRYLMHAAMRHFFQNGGGPCYVVSVGLYGDAARAPDIEAGDDQRGLIGGLAPLRKEQEPTLLVVPDAVLLSSGDCTAVQAAVLKHCGGDMRNRFAILDVWGGDRGRDDPAGDCIERFRHGIGSNFLGFGAAYYPWMHTALMEAGDFRYWMLENVADLALLISEELQLDQAAADDKAAELHRRTLADMTRSGMDAVSQRMQLDKSLLAMSELYARIRDEALVQMNLMPPSAAMAGLYTMDDNTRGVWKAPASLSMAGVIAPAVPISTDEQEDLNVSADGKSINAIRSFMGEGVLVWGGRTLDGNSPDWRDINVRRTMIMIEESCRLAAKAFVFEANVQGTWAKLQAMMTDYLTSVWKRGGLAGAVPGDAFSVQVGLGQTMTPEDILEGILRITVRVAISRPAEFMEITFQQQMQKS
ncbi:phage tail sheath C-terminal domain-containing protein [uncultured Pseudacidovorax sp.]|uniref:phage tail sheath family protein n=1 Tax=uncultured Pseudacidovorax sp. TaxID=679313 RepID=UPI0025F4B11B|nr:phage tail sheath C-terminal domain-containing protein [uncultured Pseudacidovorax sp.]